MAKKTLWMVKPCNKESDEFETYSSRDDALIAQSEKNKLGDEKYEVLPFWTIVSPCNVTNKAILNRMCHIVSDIEEFLQSALPKKFDLKNLQQIISRIGKSLHDIRIKLTPKINPKGSPSKHSSDKGTASSASNYSKQSWNEIQKFASTKKRKKGQKRRSSVWTISGGATESKRRKH